MTARLGVYFTFAELNGNKPCSLESFRSDLSKFRRDSVIYICSALNLLVANCGNIDEVAHDALVREAFPEQYVKIFTDCKALNERRFVFHRRQLLFVAKEAIRCCGDSGMDARVLPYWGGLGLVMVMANDHLHFGLSEDGPGANLVNTMAEFLPVTEYGGGMTELLPTMARAVLLNNRFAESLRGRPGFFDVPVLFEQATGIPLRSYQHLCLALMSLYIGIDFNRYKEDPSCFVIKRGKWYRNTSANPAIADRFLDLIATSHGQLKRNLEDRDVGANDFTHLRNHPLYDEAGTIYPFDVLFLVDKVASGPFWEVNGSLDDAKREAFHSFWGRVFEEYLDWLLTGAVDGAKNVFATSPKYTDTGEQVCDAIMVCGSDAVFLEYKGATFRAQAKYAGDPKCLQEEIERKLVGTKEKRKGVQQLATAIHKVFDKRRPAQVEGLDLSRVRCAYPLLITRDEIGGCFLVNRHLAARFKDNFDRKNVGVITTPLFTMDVAEVEAVSAYLRLAALSDILKSRWESDKLLNASFSAAANALLDQMGPQRNVGLEDAFAAAMDDAAKEFFPGAVLEHPARKGAATAVPPDSLNIKRGS